MRKRVQYRHYNCFKIQLIDNKSQFCEKIIDIQPFIKYKGLLESLQRRASKIIVKSKCSTTSIDYLKFQSLEDRRNTHILGLVKRCLNNKVPQFLKNYFKLNKEVISRETRRSNLYILTCSKN